MGGQTHCQVTAATGRFSIVSDNRLAGSGKVVDVMGSDSSTSFVYFFFVERTKAIGGLAL